MKDIEGFEGRYAITEDGEIFSVRKDIFLKKFLAKLSYSKKPGYFYVSLWTGSRNRNLLVHRLVALAYIINPNNLSTVNHKNGIKTDNRVENLEWCTSKENSQHAVRLGFITNRNELNPNARLSKAQVLEARYLYTEGVSVKNLALRLAISETHTYDILSGKYWKNI